MFRIIEILYNSLSLTWQEFKSHKVRTILSLTGVAFGIFCIIGVLVMVDSLKSAVQKEVQSLGSNTIYIDKWEYGGGPEFPWWKYVKRPEPKFREMEFLKEKINSASNICININTNAPIEFADNVVTGVNYYGVTEDFVNIQHIEMDQGRYLQQDDYDQAQNSVVMGQEVATNLFGKPEKAIGKQVQLKGGKVGNIVGLIKKQGKTVLIGGFEYDKCIIVSYRFLKTMVMEKNSSPVIMVQGKPEVSIPQLKDELEAAMRSIRKIKPTQENDFSLNDIDSFADFINNIFGYINQGGWAIAVLSLIVGMFGVANIMFVTVRERTSQIGLKKAIGAKRGMILTEFLLESAFLSIMGGLLGLLGVFILTLLASAAVGFPILISPTILGMALSICVIVGVLAGIIPASIAAKMDPVVAIRSK